jgi:hypothetical protein
MSVAGRIVVSLLAWLSNGQGSVKDTALIYSWTKERDTSVIKNAKQKMF